MTHQQILKGTKAMIFAAGLGTRLKPYTEQHPKALFPINKKPLLQRNIEYLQKFGIRDIIINVHHFAEQINDFLNTHNKFGINIEVSHEIMEALETGGGLKKASWFFSDNDLPFIAINADILSNINLHKMYAFHSIHKPLATLACTVRNTSRMLLHDEHNRLTGWRNLKTGEEKISRSGVNNQEIAFSGIHIIDPQFLKNLSDQGKFSIIDTYLKAARTEEILIYHHDGDWVVDVGKPESVEIAEKLFP